MNRIVEKVNFPIPKQPKAKRVAAYPVERKYQRTGFHAQERIAGLLKCVNVQGKEHLIKRG